MSSRHSDKSYRSQEYHFPYRYHIGESRSDLIRSSRRRRDSDERNAERSYLRKSNEDIYTLDEIRERYVNATDVDDSYQYRHRDRHHRRHNETEARSLSRESHRARRSSEDRRADNHRRIVRHRRNSNEKNNHRSSAAVAATVVESSLINYTELDFRATDSIEYNQITDLDNECNIRNINKSINYYDDDDNNNNKNSNNGHSKSVYYAFKSDDDIYESRDLANQIQSIECQQIPNTDVIQNINLSPISSTSTLAQFMGSSNTNNNSSNNNANNVSSSSGSISNVNINHVNISSDNSEILKSINCVSSTDELFSITDIDLRCNVSGNNLNQTNKLQLSEEQFYCQYKSLGCNFQCNNDNLLIQHENDCFFNGNNVKSVCSLCKLIVNSDHDCAKELAIEHEKIKLKTNWVKYSLSTKRKLLNEDLTSVWIHYCGKFIAGSGDGLLDESEEDEKVIKVVVNKNENNYNLVKKAVDQLCLRSSSNFTLNYNDFQLVCSIFHPLPFKSTFKSSFTVHLTNDTHLLLIPKQITVNITSKRLYYDNEHVLISVPSLVPIDINPANTIFELKNLIKEKIPVDWTHHTLIYNNIQLKDYMTIYVLGIVNGDKITINTL